MRALLIVNHFQISSRVGERLDGRNTSVRGLAARRSGTVLELMHASWFRPGAGERRGFGCIREVYSCPADSIICSLDNFIQTNDYC